MQSWTSSLQALSKIAKAHPHMAYCAYTQGLANKWTYLLRIVSNISDYSNLWRMLLSIILYWPWLVSLLMIWNVHCLPYLSIREAWEFVTLGHLLILNLLLQLKLLSHWLIIFSINRELLFALPVDSQQILSYATETGASSGLTALPVEEHGFALHKRAFRDAICLCYGWHPSGLPSLCACSKNFTVEHAMNCSTAGFPRIQHNELRDFTVSLLSEVCMFQCKC